MAALLAGGLTPLPAVAGTVPVASFTLASQSNYPGTQGFGLGLEGGTLATVQATLYVADGRRWRAQTSTPGLRFGGDYRLRATITPSGAEVAIDDALLFDSPGGWEPASTPLKTTQEASGLGAPGDWVAIVGDLRVALLREGVEVERQVFALSADAQRMPLPLFEPGPPRQAALNALPGDSLVVEAVLHFERRDLTAWSPLVDAYGQCVQADFPEKVHTDADLLADRAAEEGVLVERPASADFDQYGGYLRAGWREQATGFFWTTKLGAHWWLVSPEGNPVFYIGMDNVRGPATPVTGREALFAWLPPQEDPWQAALLHDPWGTEPLVDGVVFSTANLIRKYGEQGWWVDSAEIGRSRLQSWGFSGGGKWDAPYGVTLTPVLHTSATPSLAGHPDLFDPAVRESFRSELAAQIEPQRDDPKILGWSYGNEYGALITREEILQILSMPPATSAKRALLDHALNEMYAGSLDTLARAWGLAVASRDDLYAVNAIPPAADAEALRCWYADQWYAAVYDTIKGIDPNHLVIAPWCSPGWWESEQDWYLQARHCDLMGYDRYALAYEDAALARLKAEIDVPTFCGEFSFPPTYGLTRGYGAYPASSVEDEAEAGQRYYEWVKAAAEDPSCVGLNWFQYRDQPLTGRGPGHGSGLVYGEHYAFGAVSVTDRPKWPLVDRMREANLSAPQWRLVASRGPFSDLPVGYWAAGQIIACYDARIVKGYEDGTYRPEEVVRRDQMAVYIARALAGGDSAVPTGSASADFTDLPSGFWADRYITYAVTQKVVTGYLEADATHTYRPSQVVTRDQMAVFLARALSPLSERPNLPSYTPLSATSFTDVPSGFWASRHIAFIGEHGVTTGYADGTYHPERACARDQMAVFVARAFGLSAE